VSILRTKLLFLIALIVVIVLALQGVVELPVVDDSWYDGA
jgi:hypothetical protein